ncbi:PD-(D/E)XK nuclease family protein [Caminibacter pacificus]
MILKVLTTKRQIREYIKSFDNQFIPKVVSIGEFLQKAIVVDGKKFIDEDLKRIYLYEAVKNLDIEKLGLNKNFLDFFKNSDLIFGFLNEVYLERVNLDEIDLADTYQEYSEHIALLKEIYVNYKKLLDSEGFVDKITIEDFRINEGFFENIEKIELEVLGYLSKFEREILNKIPINIEVSFEVTKFNKNLINKMFGDFKEGRYIIDYHTKNVLFYEEVDRKMDVEVTHFSKRADQANFVFASIEEFVNDGIKPEKIAVILPDENFSEYLKLFDNANEGKTNLNFAMGDSFVNSEIYKKLKAIYDYISENDEIAYLKCKDYLEEFQTSDIFEFIENNTSEKEKKILDEELYKLKKLNAYLQNHTKQEVLKFILERLSALSFDDVKGGKVTVMGVLESRGADFDAVVIVDFNEEFVPNVNEKDFFLNTSIRRKVNLPTREDKEALQKNYYYTLFTSKKVKLSYVKNEEKSISRFAYELGIDDGKNGDSYYAEVLYKFSQPEKVEYQEKFELPKVLYPTTLDILLSCPKRYYLSNVLGISNEIEEEEFFGSRFHSIMENIDKLKFSTYLEYYDYIISNLLKDVNKRDYFYIKSVWDDRILEFAKKDFEFLSGNITTEVTKQRPKNDFILKARYDRIIDNMAFDYKTSTKSQNYEESTQAEFYKYILPNHKIYFWDIYNVKLVEVNPELKNLDEKLSQIKNISFKTEDEKNCRYCEFQFSCNL